MQNNEIQKYIEQQKNEGKTIQEIRAELVAVGWDEKELEGYLYEHAVQQELLSSGELWKRSRAVVKKFRSDIYRFFVPLTILMIAAVLFEYMLPTVNMNAPVAFVIAYLAVYVGVILGLIYQAYLSLAGTLLYVKAKGGVSVHEVRVQARKKILTLLRRDVVVACVLIIPLLSFVIPAVIVAVFFSLSVAVVVLEDMKVIPSLEKSIFLVRGYFGKVLWRWLVFILKYIVVAVLVGIVVSPLGIAGTGLESVVGDVVLALWGGLFFGPLFVVYLYLIYSNLSLKKSQETFVHTQGFSILVWVFGVLGAFIVLIPLLSFGILIVLEETLVYQGQTVIEQGVWRGL
jgi:hypothetical protein